MIITGGENVNPPEVEEALYERPEIEECAVVGLPDPQWGEKVAAFIVPKKGKTVVADDVKEFLKTKLALFKTPKSHVIINELPKSVAGQIMNREIKQRYQEGDEEGRQE